MAKARRNIPPQTKTRSYMSKTNRRAMIIKASAPVFAEKGYHKTSITDICKASQIAQGTLYLHFTNKLEIFQGILLEIMNNLHRIMEPRGVIESGIDVKTTNEALNYLRQKVLKIFTIIKENRDLLMIVFKEAPGLDPSIDRSLVQMKNAMLAQIETEQVIFQRLGLTRIVNPKLASQMILGIMVMIIMDNVFEDENPDVELLASNVCDLIFYGIVIEKSDVEKK